MWEWWWQNLWHSFCIVWVLCVISWSFREVRTDVRCQKWWKGCEGGDMCCSDQKNVTCYEQKFWVILMTLPWKRWFLRNEKERYYTKGLVSTKLCNMMFLSRGAETRCLITASGLTIKVDTLQGSKSHESVLGILKEQCGWVVSLWGKRNIVSKDRSWGGIQWREGDR